MGAPSTAGNPLPAWNQQRWNRSPSLPSVRFHWSRKRRSVKSAAISDLLPLAIKFKNRPKMSRWHTVRCSMMSEERFDARLKHIEEQHAARRESADAYRDQEMAKLFEESAWTQERIAQRVGK